MTMINRYKVVIHETFDYVVNVDASNEEEARELAERAWMADPDIGYVCSDHTLGPAIKMENGDAS